MFASIKHKIHRTRGKSKQEQIPCEQFLQQIEISRTFLRAKQVGEKRAIFDFPLRCIYKIKGILRCYL